MLGSSVGVAIAATLAGFAIPAHAQDATPATLTTAPPPVVVPTLDPAPAPAPAPVAAAPAAASPAASNGIGDPQSATPVSQSAIAQVEAERAARQTARSANAVPVARATRPTRSAAPASPRVTPVADTAPAPVAASPVANPQPLAAPLEQPAAPAAIPAAQPVEQASGNDVPDGALIGGLALLGLGGLGLAGYAGTRRRRVDRDTAVEMRDTSHEAELRPTARPMTKPVMAPEPMAAEPAFVPVAAPAHATPAFAAAPAMARSDASGRTIGRHEAAALMGPTPENPFLTRRNRLKRARFYDRRERMEAADMPLASQARPAGMDAPSLGSARTAATQGRPSPKPKSAKRLGGWSLGGFRPAYSS